MYVASKIPNLPRTSDLYPNSSAVAGAVALFNYGGTPHYAVVEAINVGSITVSETNYHHGKFDRREVSLSDDALLGFWTA